MVERIAGGLLYSRYYYCGHYTGQCVTLVPRLAHIMLAVLQSEDRNAGKYAN